MKNKKEVESKICGESQAAIRKAYFSKGLDAIIDRIMESRELNEEETAKLAAFLERLEGEKKKVHDTLKDKGFDLHPDEIKPPSVDELETNVDPEKLKKWTEQVEIDEKYIRDLMKSVGIATTRKSLKVDDLKDVILEITIRMVSLDQNRVYKDQLYRGQLTRIIDKYGISRAEAEERAKLTKEYRDYKLAVLFKENLIEFIMAAKKKVGTNW